MKKWSICAAHHRVALGHRLYVGHGYDYRHNSASDGVVWFAAEITSADGRDLLSGRTCREHKLFKNSAASQGVTVMDAWRKRTRLSGDWKWVA